MISLRNKKKNAPKCWQDRIDYATTNVRQKTGKFWLWPQFSCIPVCSKMTAKQMQTARFHTNWIVQPWWTGKFMKYPHVWSRTVEEYSIPVALYWLRGWLGHLRQLYHLRGVWNLCGMRALILRRRRRDTAGVRHVVIPGVEWVRWHVAVQVIVVDHPLVLRLLALRASLCVFWKLHLSRGETQDALLIGWRRWNTCVHILLCYVVLVASWNRFASETSASWYLLNIQFDAVLCLLFTMELTGENP